MSLKNQLVICEKPRVAKSISAVLGANKRGDGFFHGNGYIVSWCYGHLLELAKPEAYDKKYKKWRYEDLPIIPTSHPGRMSSRYYIFERLEPICQK